MSITYAKKIAPVQNVPTPSASSIHDSSSQSESLQRKADIANNAAQREEAPRPNNTGMPDNLKSGIESLSGFSMDDVRVHYNSSKPATVQALAYTQGTDIHVAPGQEKHLPHEAWHVAQQMAGRVSPTTNINGMPVNDNAGLEHEADVMGEKAVQNKKSGWETCLVNINQTEIIQRDPLVKFFEGSHKKRSGRNEEVVKDIVEREGGQYDKSKDFHIAFETFGNNAKQLEQLYVDVISRYKGKATVIIGINVEASLNKIVSGGFYESDKAYHEKVGKCLGAENVSDITDIPSKLQDEVDALSEIKPNDNHKIIIYPFVYDGRYKQGGDYNMPYCEIRGKLMDVASKSNANLYRWIDRDCRDDSSIELFNNGLSFRGLGNCFVSAAYDWRVDGGVRVNDAVRNMINLVNHYEHQARNLFFKIRESLNLSRKMEDDSDVCKYYLPETILYMSPTAHDAAKARLKKVTVNQSRESEHASPEKKDASPERKDVYLPTQLVFMNEIHCTKPLKGLGTDKSYFLSLEKILPSKTQTKPVDRTVFVDALKGLRQTVFDESSWYFLEEHSQAIAKWNAEKTKMLDEMFTRYCREVFRMEPPVQKAKAKTRHGAL